MTLAILRLFTVSAFFLGLGLFAEMGVGWAAQGVQHPGKTWKSLSELSEEERAQIDLSTDTPRHAEIPYLPAEPYPYHATVHS